MPAFVLALLAMPAIEAPAPGNAAAARAFLQSIYRLYGKGGNGARLDRPERYFEPVLAAAIRKDQAEADARGDMNKMDADPFCNCQDFEGMSPAVVGPVTVKGNRATATVRFAFGDDTQETRFTLVWTRLGWRVFDLGSEDWNGVRAMYFSKG
ncbi:MAG: hypothetical protein V4574_12070 [Pseudomonadota bacterium]